MTGPSHAIFALASCTALALASGLKPTKPTYLLLLLLGSLAPDIDGGGSITRIGTLVKAFIGWRVAKVVDGVSEGLCSLIAATLGHRGLIHSALIPSVLLPIAWYIESLGLFWFAFGYATHLAGDYITHMGIPAFAPFKTSHYSAHFMYTGSAKEWCITAILVLYTTVYGFSLLPENLKEGFQELAARLSL